MMKTDSRSLPKDAYGADRDVHVQQGSAAKAGLFVRVFKVPVLVLFRLFFQVRVYGRRNVPRRPVIVCANHLGWTDAFLILLFFPIEPRVYALGERQVKHISPFRNWVINHLQIMVPLDRGKPREALSIMGDVLQRGGSLLINPEGRLGKEEGTIGELQRGAAHLSQITGVPLLPVGLTGPSELWLRRRLEVRIGRPIYPGDFEGDQRDRIRLMTARLDTAMRALLPGDKQRVRFKPLRKWLTNLL